MSFSGFDPDLIQFLKDLEKNNDKKWFEKNKKRFEESVQIPMLQFIEAMEPRLRNITSHLVAIPKKTGGSLSRIYRDVRFSKDKTPFHNYVMAKFIHEVGKNHPSAGFFIKIEPDQVCFGSGACGLDNPAISKIRSHIDSFPKEWVKARDNKKFKKLYGELGGGRLKRPPRGYEEDHPLIEDLKRKDFMAGCPMKTDVLLKKNLPAEAEKIMAAASPLVGFVNESLGLPF